MALDIVAVMEEWARWSSQRDFHGWPSKTILGRCIEDMPTTKCTTCDGKGQIPGKEVGSTKEFIHCEMCKGKGKIPMTSSISKINPALIGGTEQHRHLPKIQFNFLAHKVDLVIKELPENQQEIVGYEYCMAGSQAKKSRILQIPQQKYSRELKRVHAKVIKSLTSDA